MASIVVVLPKLEEAKGIKNLLARHGFTVHVACATGAQAINTMDELNSGIVICGYKLVDMMYREVRENMPADFEMLLLANQGNLGEVAGDNIVALAMPLKAADLINTVDMMCQNIDRKRRRAKLVPKTRSAEDANTILEAKKLLMDRNNMTEEEAHRYIQKCSMDSSTNMVETAQMILTMMA